MSTSDDIEKLRGRQSAALESPEGPKGIVEREFVSTNNHRASIECRLRLAKRNGDTVGRKQAEAELKALDAPKAAEKKPKAEDKPKPT